MRTSELLCDETIKKIQNALDSGILDYIIGSDGEKMKVERYSERCFEIDGSSEPVFLLSDGGYVSIFSPGYGDFVFNKRVEL